MPSDHPDSSESSLSAIRAWIAERRESAGEVDLDQDLIESRIIDSLDFAEFLFFLEEVSGDEAIELLTGIPAGTEDSRGRLPEGSINRLVATRLAHMSDLRQAFGGATLEPQPAPVRRLPTAVGMRLARPRRGI
jgi:hypothetical protein